MVWDLKDKHINIRFTKNAKKGAFFNFYIIITLEENLNVFYTLGHALHESSM